MFERHSCRSRVDCISPRSLCFIAPDEHHGQLGAQERWTMLCFQAEEKSGDGFQGIFDFGFGGQQEARGALPLVRQPRCGRKTRRTRAARMSGGASSGVFAHLPDSQTSWGWGANRKGTARSPFELAAKLHHAADRLQAPSEIITRPLRMPAWSNEKPPVLCELQRPLQTLRRGMMSGGFLLNLAQSCVMSFWIL